MEYEWSTERNEQLSNKWIKTENKIEEKEKARIRNNADNNDQLL